MRQKIPRRHARCSSCHGLFVYQARYCTLLSSSERRDYCPSCWQQIALTERVASSEETLFWKGKVVSHKKREGLSPRQQRALGLVFGADHAEKSDPKRALLFYLLALYLERGRCLLFRQKREDNWLLYEEPLEREQVEIPLVQLVGVDWPQVLSQLEQLLDGSSSALLME